MIYVLYGPDDFSIREAVVKLLRAAVPPDTADLNTTRLTAAEVTPDGLRFACETAPFLADRRAVVVDGFFSRSKARRGRTAKREPAPADGDSEVDGTPAGATEVAAYIPRVPANTLLIFVEPDAPPKTGPIARAFEAAGAKLQYFPTLAGPPLARWIKERGRLAGGHVADGAASLLATYIGGDLRTLANEVQKLVTYAGPGRTVDVEDVQVLVNQVAEVNIFALVDAIGQGRRRDALRALHTLLETGERPERVLGMVSRQVRLLLQARDVQDRREPPDVVAKTLGLSGFPLRKVQEQARLFTVERLKSMHRHVLEADLSIKTGQQTSSLALELLVTDLTAHAPSGVRRTVPGAGRSAARPATGRRPLA